MRRLLRLLCPLVVSVPWCLSGTILQQVGDRSSIWLHSEKIRCPALIQGNNPAKFFIRFGR
jgi:hypothetical protein